MLEMSFGPWLFCALFACLAPTLTLADIYYHSEADKPTEVYDLGLRSRLIRSNVTFLSVPIRLQQDANGKTEGEIVLCRSDCCELWALQCRTRLLEDDNRSK